MYLSNKVYDVLKWIAEIALPAAGALYFALAGIWGFPYGEQIIGTIAAVDTFLGAILMISSKSYKENMYTFNIPIEKLEETGRVTFVLPNQNETEEK